MHSNKTKHIVCTVRGIPQSRATATKAIDLALEHEARLTFAQVNNADFLISAGLTLASLPMVKKQIHSLSEFAMVVLCDRAQRRGVEHVDYILRDGKILPQLYALLSELTPDFLVIGRPVGPGAEVSSLKSSDIENFIQEVEDNLKISVIPVEIKIN